MTNNTDGAALLPVTQEGPFHVSHSSDGTNEWFSARDPASCVIIPASDRDDAYALVSSLNRACSVYAARHRIATQEDAERSERREGFAPCPTCRQYSHSIDDDALANAFMHFEAMAAHPVRGHPMGHIYDDATRDAAQVLVAAAKGASTPQRQEYDAAPAPEGEGA